MEKAIWFVLLLDCRNMADSVERHPLFYEDRKKTHGKANGKNEKQPFLVPGDYRLIKNRCEYHIGFQPIFTP